MDLFGDIDLIDFDYLLDNSEYVDKSVFEDFYVNVPEVEHIVAPAIEVKEPSIYYTILEI